MSVQNLLELSLLFHVWGEGQLLYFVIKCAIHKQSKSESQDKQKIILIYSPRMIA